MKTHHIQYLDSMFTTCDISHRGIVGQATTDIARLTCRRCLLAVRQCNWVGTWTGTYCGEIATHRKVDDDLMLCGQHLSHYEGEFIPIEDAA